MKLKWNREDAKDITKEYRMSEAFFRERIMTL